MNHHLRLFPVSHRKQFPKLSQTLKLTCLRGHTCSSPTSWYVCVVNVLVVGLAYSNRAFNYHFLGAPAHSIQPLDEAFREQGFK